MIQHMHTLKMMTTMYIINMVTHSYRFFLVNLRICSLSNSIGNMSLTIVIMLCITSPGLIYFITGLFASLIPVIHFYLSSKLLQPSIYPLYL